MSWGFAVAVDELDADLEELLMTAVGGHFDEIDRAATIMEQHAEYAAQQGAGDELVTEAREAAAYTRGAAIAGREQATSAVPSVVALLRAGHIAPVMVSLTGEANPDHAADHDRGLPARIVVSLVRA